MDLIEKLAISADHSAHYSNNMSLSNTVCCDHPFCSSKWGFIGISTGFPVKKGKRPDGHCYWVGEHPKVYRNQNHSHYTGQFIMNKSFTWLIRPFRVGFPYCSLPFGLTTRRVWGRYKSPRYHKLHDGVAMEINGHHLACPIETTSTHMLDCSPGNLTVRPCKMMIGRLLSS